MRFDYPEGYTYSGGCKVCWRTYANEKDAAAASLVALAEARHMEELGYDWGYQSPGHIRPVEGGFCVTCP